MSDTEEYWNTMVPELSVSDFDKSIKFYCDILGFEVLYQRSSPDFAYLQLEKVQLMIDEIHADMWQTGELVYPLGRGINLQMELTDIAPVLKRVQDASIILYREQQDVWYDIGDKLTGVRQFLLQDPDGYLLRFIQHLGEKPKG